MAVAVLEAHQLRLTELQGQQTQVAAVAVVATTLVLADLVAPA